MYPPVYLPAALSPGIISPCPACMKSNAHGGKVNELSLLLRFAPTVMWRVFSSGKENMKGEGGGGGGGGVRQTETKRNEEEEGSVCALGVSPCMSCSFQRRDVKLMSLAVTQRPHTHMRCHVCESKRAGQSKAAVWHLFYFTCLYAHTHSSLPERERS